MAKIDFNVFELEMSQERVKDLEAQLDAIMSGEYNARNVIDSQIKEIKKLKEEKQEVIDKSADALNQISFLERNKLELELKNKDLEVSEEYLKDETKTQKERIKSLEDDLF